MRRYLPLLLLVCPAPFATANEDVRFARDVLPVLSENCFHCHGPDEEQRQADLRVDTADGIAAAIHVDNPNNSELLKRILSTDPDVVMPPPNSNRTLSSQQKKALQAWVERGAEWGGHWAFEPLTSPPVPKPSFDDTPARNPIDHFVQKKLAQKKLRPSQQARQTTLLRRVHLDLTGLPPSVAEVRSFLADSSDTAYEHIVDNLLNRPSFGERMAWDWLDAARYADTNGYQGDRERTMWPWRDWVVDAFNSNMPFDQFTTYQLAGDLLPDATEEQKLATGFCRNYMINGEGGRIAEENRVDYVMDMSETMGTVWLGLTLNCCRCHDHKYDPLTQKEYYQFFAFFNQTSVNGGGGDPQTAPNLATPTLQQKTQLQQLDEQLKTVRQLLKAERQSVMASLPAWEQQQLNTERADEWTVLKPTSLQATHQQLKLLDDVSVLVDGANAENDTYTLRYPLTAGILAAVRLEAIRHDSMTNKGLARSDSGNFVLTEFACSIIEPADEPSVQAAPTTLNIASSEATYEQGELKIGKAHDGNTSTGWAVYEGRPIDRDHAAVFRFQQPLKVLDGDVLQVVMKHDSPHKFHNLGRFRLSASSTPSAPLTTSGSDKLLAALNTPAEQRSAEQRSTITTEFLNKQASYSKLASRQKAVAKQKQNLIDAAPKVMVMEDQKQWRPTFVLNRGLYNDITDKEVTAATPVSLPLPSKSSERMNRLDLAEWLLSDRHPLTARVTVNRFWQQFFGIGLVKTTEDFGVQAEYPEHKDLLDWLAYDFRNNNWDIKRLVRQIVTSHTYRQSSIVRPSALTDADGRPISLAEVDPENRLLARASRFRMPSWMLRDHALAAAGLLNRELGGPPVNTYQPEGVWEEATFGNKKYTQDTGDKLYRRSLYIFWRRIIAPTMFFDNASRQSCTVKPFLTNTPLHSLLTLNETTYVEAARILAEDVLTNDSLVDDSARLETAFLSILNRSPTEQERAILLAGLQRSLSEYQAEPTEAAQLLSVGESTANKQLDSATHAAWTSACLTLFNTDEALSRE